MKNYTEREIIKTIEQECQKWADLYKKFCRNNNLTDKEKYILRTLCDIRIDTLKVLKSKFEIFY